MAKTSISGKWRITEMDLWDQEAIDLLGPACIEFKGHGGQFPFIAVEGWMDCRHGLRTGRPYVDFTWHGNDECDPASGRGFVKLQKDGSLTGHIYLHHGDAPGFKAIPFEDDEQPAAKASPRTKRGLRVDRVRSEHPRKTRLMAGFEEIVARLGPSEKLSFLERAKARWGARQQGDGGKRQHKATTEDLDLSRPAELVVLAVKERAARCRLLGSDRAITLRASDL